MYQSSISKPGRATEELLVTMAAAAAPLNHLLALGVDHSAEVQAMRVFEALTKRVRKSLTVIFEYSEASFHEVSHRELPGCHVSVYKQLWQCAVKNGIDTVCVSGTPVVPTDPDPWSKKTAVSVAHWHRLAAVIRDLHAKDPQRLLLGIFAPWTASKRGVPYSLPYVDAAGVASMSYFIGRETPVSQLHGVAQFDFECLV